MYEYHSPSLRSRPSSTPSISIELHISPVINIQDPTPPTLSVTAVLHADRPITVLTWATILDPEKRRNFWADDLGSELPVPVHLEILKCVKRINAPDQRYYLTLHPDTPTTVSCPFWVAHRINHRGSNDGHTRIHRLRREWALYMEPGHRYRFGVADGEGIDQWRWGTKDEVLGARGFKLREVDERIVFDRVRPVEIELLE